MFIRKNRNRSGSYSIQIISKRGGRYKVLKTLGSGRSNQEIEFLYQRARQELQKIEGTLSLFVDRDDALIESFVSTLKNSQVQVIGPELIFGKIYDAIGFNQVENILFRHLVITRLYQPGSKLKTIDYLQRFLGIEKKVDEIYRFLYIPVENHTKFQLKTIPLINAYLRSFFNKWVKNNNDKYEYKTKDYPSQIPGWLFRTEDIPRIKD